MGRKCGDCYNFVRWECCADTPVWVDELLAEQDKRNWVQPQKDATDCACYRDRTEEKHCDKYRELLPTDSPPPAEADCSGDGHYECGACYYLERK